MYVLSAFVGELLCAFRTSACPKTRAELQLSGHRRFRERLTIGVAYKETNALYESIKRELSSAKTTPVLESKVQSAEKSTMNESTIYKSPEIANMLGLIQRMDNCYKK